MLLWPEAPFSHHAGVVNFWLRPPIVQYYHVCAMLTNEHCVDIKLQHPLQAHKREGKL